MSVGPVVAPAPVASFDAPAPVAPASLPTMAASVDDQVLTVLAPLRTADDGSHMVTLALEPEGLGNVQATVSVGPQSLAVNLWAESPTGHAALSQSVAQLHEQLTVGMDRHVTVDLADFGSAQPDSRGHTDASPGDGRSPAARPDTAPDYETVPHAAASDQPVDTSPRRVDLRL
jgi:hypothetical protein